MPCCREDVSKPHTAIKRLSTYINPSKHSAQSPNQASSHKSRLPLLPIQPPCQDTLLPLNILHPTPLALLSSQPRRVIPEALLIIMKPPALLRAPNNEALPFILILRFDNHMVSAVSTIATEGLAICYSVDPGYVHALGYATY